MSLSAHPPARRLLVAGPIRRIISGLDLREPLHAHGMDFSQTMLERLAPDVFGDLAIAKCSFECDELSFLESPGELREIALGIDTMPFGACLLSPLSFFQLSWVAMLRTT